MKKTAWRIVLSLLIIGMLTPAFKVQPIKADTKTIYVDSGYVAGTGDVASNHIT